MSAGGRKIVAVAGGTGLLGRSVLQALLARGDAEVRIIARTAVSTPECKAYPADLETGAGLAEALKGSDAAIWCTHDRAALANDGLWVRKLLEHCAAAGVSHFLYTGIAGIETASASPYYGGKLREEAIIAASSVPHTILRATQFHTLAVSLLETCDDGARINAPARMMLRPLAHEMLADRLAVLAFEAPQGRVRDLAGPEDGFVPDLARQWILARGMTREIVEVAHAPERWAMLQSLTHGDAERAGPSFSQWLAGQSR